MDSDDLINRVVEKVVARMQQRPVEAVPQARPSLPGPAQGPTSGAFGQRGDGRGGGTGAGSGRRQTEAPSRAAKGSSCIVVLTAGDGELDEVFRQVGMLAGSFDKVEVFMSPSARKVLDLPALRRACPRMSLLPQEVTHEMRSLVDGCQAVYLPNLTLSTASKIAFLDGDSAASLIPIFALMRGRLVAAASNSVFGLRADFPDVPQGFRGRVDKIFKNLAENGVAVVDIRDLSSVLPGSARAASLAPAQSPLPGQAPAQAVQANQAQAARVLSTARDAAPPCNGDPETCAACGQCADKIPQAVASIVESGADRIAASKGTRVTDRNIAALIDHTLLKPDATEEDIRKLCQEARQHSFASVCVNPTNVALAARLLQGSTVKVCTVIGFPLGATTPTTKAMEARDAIANGATEIDMVINVGALKSGDDDLVRRDIAAVVDACRGQALVKVILETALLSKEEKVKACLLAKMAGADFVKTSTGFGPGGATVEDIALMRETVGPQMGVKASGGIRDTRTAQAMVAAGATRIGASASVAITKGQDAGAGAY